VLQKEPARPRQAPSYMVSSSMVKAIPGHAYAISPEISYTRSHSRTFCCSNYDKCFRCLDDMNIVHSCVCFFVGSLSICVCAATSACRNVIQSS
jgi:hypothetical protein